MFARLPFAYVATVRTHMRGRRKTRLFRDEGLFEVREIRKSELREAVRVRLDRTHIEPTDPTHDVLFAYDDCLYRPALKGNLPVSAIGFEAAGSAAPPSRFRGLRHAAPRLPIVARRPDVVLTGPSRLPSMEEAAAEEKWHFRALIADDRASRYEEAYLHHRRAVLIVDGYLYLQAHEPGWFVIGTGIHRPAMVQYDPRLSNFPGTWLFSLDDHQGVLLDAANGTGLPATVNYDSTVELLEPVHPRADAMSNLAEYALAYFSELSAAAGVLKRKDEELGAAFAALREAFMGPVPVPASDAERVVALTIGVIPKVEYRVSSSERSDTVDRLRKLLRDRARTILGRDPSVEPPGPELDDDDRNALWGL